MLGEGEGYFWLAQPGRLRPGEFSAGSLTTPTPHPGTALRGPSQSLIPPARA